MDAYFNWYVEASKRIQDSATASLQNTISEWSEVNKQLEEDNIGGLLTCFTPHQLPLPHCAYLTSLVPPPPHSSPLPEPLSFLLI